MPAAAFAQPSPPERYAPPPARASLPVEVTLLCADVVGFTAMTERLGDLRALEAMRDLAARVRREAAVRGGRVLEIRGDAFLLAFGHPAVHGMPGANAATRALACARALHCPDPRPHDAATRVRLRIAIHSGNAIPDGSGYFGRDVIVPYRLLSQAAAGRTLLSSDAAARLPASDLAGARRVCGFAARGIAAPLDFIVIDHGGTPPPRTDGPRGPSKPGPGRAGGTTWNAPTDRLRPLRPGREERDGASALQC